MTETIPYEYIETQGVIVPDTADIQSEVEQEYMDAFQDQTLVVTADTPQGVMITAQTLGRTAVVNNNAAIANQINPNVAGGIFLDAIMALTGQQRNAATYTLVTNVTVTGTNGTIITEGSQATTEAGDVFQTTSQVTFDSTGTAFVSFMAANPGAVPCAAGALNIIVTGVLGWETVNNSASSTPASVTTLGVLTQSDQSARALRQNTLAMNGISLAAAITSALYNVAGVTSLFFQENIANTTETINAISMAPHSVYACVEGGADADVAAALLENKSSGAAWNGGTSVTVIEPSSGQAYEVLYDRPTQVGILIQVTTPNGNETAIIQAILDYAAGLIEITNQNGTTGTLPGFTVGADVSPFDIAGAIMAENPGIYIKNLQIGLAPSGSLSPSQIAIGVNQIAYTQTSYISVVVP